MHINWLRVSGIKNYEGEEAVKELSKQLKLKPKNRPTLIIHSWRSNGKAPHAFDGFKVSSFSSTTDACGTEYSFRFADHTTKNGIQLIKEIFVWPATITKESNNQYPLLGIQVIRG